MLVVKNITLMTSKKNTFTISKLENSVTQKRMILIMHELIINIHICQNIAMVTVLQPGR